jgi:spore coat polysaccharide biosynthesis protein SpsF
VNAETAIVLQARMGSTRLPGKILSPINGKPLLEHCIERLQQSTLPVIVATTTLSDDDVVADIATELGAGVVRGAADDVLARYALAVSEFGLFEVIRATADNPAVDIDAPQRCLELLRRTGVDHVVERGLPYGAAVEAVSASAILLAAAQAVSAADREHVTPFIKRDGQFVAIDAIAPGILRRPYLRLTVDTPEDLEFIRKVFGRLLDTTAPSSLAEIIRAVDRLNLSEAEGGDASALGTR